MSDETPRRCWLFHASCRDGKIFEGDQIDAALEDGWTESPTDLPEAEVETPDLEAQNEAAEMLAAKDAAIEELQETIDALKGEAANKDAELEAVKKELSTTKGQLTKAEKKIEKLEAA